MRLSIIMPVHNAGKYLERSITSILNQSITDWELCVVDDGSTDNSVEIIKGFMASDSRIKLLSREEKGYGITMNNLLDMCEGEYICDVDPDDWIESDMFEIMVNAIEDNSCDIVKCGFMYELPDGLQQYEQIKETDIFCPIELPYHNRIEWFCQQTAIWSQIYSRDFLNRNSIRLHETSGAAFQDTAFIFKCNCYAKRVKAIDKMLYHYNKTNANSSTAKQDEPFATSIEFRWMHKFLDEHPEFAVKTRSILIRQQFGGCMWNMMRIKEEDERQFALMLKDDFSKVWEWLDSRMFNFFEYRIIDSIINNTDMFLESIAAQKRGDKNDG